MLWQLCNDMQDKGAMVDITSKDQYFLHNYHCKVMIIYFLSMHASFQNILISVIGTPPKEMWPKESSISADQFGLHKPIAWTELIVRADYQAIELISVSALLHACPKLTRIMSD